MSNFVKYALNPKTGKAQKAHFIDDHFGQHRYGVAFRTDGGDLEFDDPDFANHEVEIYNADLIYEHSVVAYDAMGAELLRRYDARFDWSTHETPLAQIEALNDMRALSDLLLKRYETDIDVHED